MEDYYYNPKEKRKTEDIVGLRFEQDLYEETEKGDFHIGQSYTEEPDKTIVCKLYRGDKFIVGAGEWHTSIKCPNCNWELCIHDG